MALESSIGKLDLIAMLIVLGLQDQAYGVSLAHKITRTTGREIAFGTVYAVLERLERNGLASSSPGESTSERGGRAKRYFPITAKGLREVNRSKRALLVLCKGVPHLEESEA